jgi:hypothetical protein
MELFLEVIHVTLRRERVRLTGGHDVFSEVYNHDVTIGPFEEDSVPPEQSSSAPSTIYAQKKSIPQRNAFRVPGNVLLSQGEAPNYHRR